MVLFPKLWLLHSLPVLSSPLDMDGKRERSHSPEDKQEEPNNPMDLVRKVLLGLEGTQCLPASSPELTEIIASLFLYSFNY